MAQRIKGQEVQLLFVVDGVAKEAITDIRNFEVAAQLELLKEGYLGETTDRRDDVFHGLRGKMELHFESRAVLDLIVQLIDRARRRTPGTRVNIKATLNFPNGDRPRVLIQDAFFGEAPMTFGSRSDYGSVNLEFESSEYTVI